jgi:hypothetical protein
VSNLCVNIRAKKLYLLYIGTEGVLDTIISKSAKKICIPYEQVQVHPHVSAFKTLNQEDQYNVYLFEDATEVVKGNTSKCGKPIISCAIGTSCYYGLCDLGASISAIPYSLYMEVKSDIDPIKIEETCMTIQLANKETICHVGIVREVDILVGKVKYPVDFVVLACPQDSF